MRQHGAPEREGKTPRVCVCVQKTEGARVYRVGCTKYAECRENKWTLKLEKVREQKLCFARKRKRTMQAQRARARIRLQPIL